MQKNTKPHQPSSLSRPPIVTILGHVDHGKTTLLDKIRKSHVAAKEEGGITQHIGAYQITVASDPAKRAITFIDTPGHQAFAKMRVRGAQVADIAVLVIAANDGIMPQTIESIGHTKDAKIPAIIALNKIDLPDTNTDKIKKQLTTHGFNLEEYGGDTPVIPLSAKTGEGVDKLLSMILLLSEMHEVKEENPGQLKGIVIESALSKQRGATGTVILRSGKLKVGEDIANDTQIFRVRAILDEYGKSKKEIGPGDPGLILGWKLLPQVGSLIRPKNLVKEAVIAARPIAPPGIPLYIPQSEEKKDEKVRLILKTDTAGSLEAISASLKDNVDIIEKYIGAITESDILLAKTTHALVIGFHIPVSESVIKLAQTEKVLIKTYDIIYELLDEIDDVVDALKKGNLVTILGEAKVQALFPHENDLIAGIKVLSGRIAKGDQVKIMRNEEEIGRSRIKSMRHLKQETTKAEQGTEAGILLSSNLPLLTGDSIISIG